MELVSNFLRHRFEPFINELLGLLQPDMSVRFKQVLTIDHYFVSFAHAVLNNGETSFTSSGFDGLDLSGEIRADYVDEVAVWSFVHRIRWNDQCLLPSIDQEPNIHKLARPQIKLSILKNGLQLNGAGCLVDLVIHRTQFSLIQDLIIFLIGCNDGEGVVTIVSCDSFGNFAQVTFWQCKYYRDRSDLSDNHQACLVACVNYISLINQPKSNSSINR